MSRGSIKEFLLETVAYAFTHIPLLFGQPQLLLFLRKWLTVAQGKALEMIPKYGRTEAQSWP